MTEVHTDTIEQTHVDAPPKLQEPGDHDRFAHYVRARDLERALLDGIPAVALCGKKWLPTRNPKDFPVCQECKEKYEAKDDDITPEMEG
jgi:hypothetical protein